MATHYINAPRACPARKRYLTRLMRLECCLFTSQYFQLWKRTLNLLDRACYFFYKIIKYKNYVNPFCMKKLISRRRAWPYIPMPKGRGITAIGGKRSVGTIS